MPQDITINGAQYPDVPAVQIPKTGGGTAQFDDTTDATATASEIASGKTAYVNNARLVGTGQMVEPPLYIDPSINGVGIGAAPENDHELTIASGYHINAKGKDNRFTYMPYSWQAVGVDGATGYARLATISVVGNYVGYPIEFDVFHHNGVVKLFVHFNSVNNTDPTISKLTYDSTGVAVNAFIYKTATSTWDLYIQKDGAYDYLTVSTIVPRWNQSLVNISYSNALLTSVPNDAVIATELPIVNTAKYNVVRYQPFTWNTNGGSNSNGYARLATIRITSGWATAPIEFKILRRNQKTTITFYVKFWGGSDTDPEVDTFYYEGYANYSIDAFLTKTSAGIWDLYIKKTEASDYITIYSYVPNYMQSRCNVTYSESLLTSVPSGAILAKALPPVEPSVTFTKTSGGSNASEIHIDRQGALCILSFKLLFESSTAVGGNCYIGTVNGPRPRQNTSGVAYHYSSCLVARLATDGTLAVRVTGAATSNQADSGTFTLVYFTND